MLVRWCLPMPSNDASIIHLVTSRPSGEVSRPTLIEVKGHVVIPLAFYPAAPGIFSHTSAPHSERYVCQFRPAQHIFSPSVSLGSDTRGGVIFCSRRFNPYALRCEPPFKRLVTSESPYGYYHLVNSPILPDSCSGVTIATRLPCQPASPVCSRECSDYGINPERPAGLLAQAYPWRTHKPLDSP